MKIPVIILFMLLWFSSSASAQEKIDCSRKARFGKAEICLPNIEGFKECYLDLYVKQLADKTEVPGNQVLGYYLENETYDNVGISGLSGLNSFIKIYGTKRIQDYKADFQTLKQVQSSMSENYISKNWDSIEKSIDKIGIDIKLGTPTIIKTYNLNKQSFTYVMLSRNEVQGMEPFTLAMTINGLLINERLIWMAYFVNYEDEETVSLLQKKSNEVLTSLLKK